MNLSVELIKLKYQTELVFSVLLGILSFTFFFRTIKLNFITLPNREFRFTNYLRTNDASNLLVHHYTIEPYYLSTANDGPQYTEYSTPIIPLTEHNLKGNVMTQKPHIHPVFYSKFFLTTNSFIISSNELQIWLHQASLHIVEFKSQSIGRHKNNRSVSLSLECCELGALKHQLWC